MDWGFNWMQREQVEIKNKINKGDIPHFLIKQARKGDMLHKTFALSITNAHYNTSIISTLSKFSNTTKKIISFKSYT